MKSSEQAFYKKVSKRIRYALERSQYSIQDLSKQLDIPYMRIYRAVMGSQYISLIDYIKVCMFLNLPLDTFIFEQEGKK